MLRNVLLFTLMLFISPAEFIHGEEGINSKEDFEELRCLKSNIDFWEDIYIKYSETDMLIHNNMTFEIYKGATVPPLTNKRDRKRVVDKLMNEVRESVEEDNNNLRAQSGIRNKFEKGYKISKKLIPKIRKALVAEDMPPELAYIPLIESSFQFNARSKVGAYGIWQIMPATLKVYSKAHRKKLGDLDFSTKIAILILKDNYEQLGSWPLAINAYHSGLGRMKQAKEELNTTDMCRITSEFKGRAYKFASRNYYAQFLAAKRIVDRREKKNTPNQ